MSETYLIHFGILGMEHGKRNGPPYPLDSGDHSSKEKSAAKSAGVKVGQDSGKGSIYSINAKHYNKKADKLQKKTDVARTMASMNEAAAKNGKGVISKINKINADHYNKKADKLQKKTDVNRTMASMNENAHNQKLISKEYHKMRQEAHRKIDNKADLEKEKIYKEAVKRYDDKVKKGKVEYNPDDWDFKYEDRELKKLSKKTQSEKEKAYSDIDSYLSKKYNTSMDTFRKNEKANIDKGIKRLETVEKGLFVVSAAALVGTMGYVMTHPNGK